MGDQVRYGFWISSFVDHMRGSRGRVGGPPPPHGITENEKISYLYVKVGTPWKNVLDPRHYCMKWIVLPYSESMNFSKILPIFLYSRILLNE